MSTGNYSNGFSKARIVIILALLLIAVGGFFGYQWYTERQQRSDAIAFGNSFVSNIQKQSYEQSYAQLNVAAASRTGSIDDWTKWVNTAKSSGIVINSSPTTVKKITTEKSPTYLLTYPTSSTITFIVTTTLSESHQNISAYTVGEK